MGFKTKEEGKIEFSCNAHGCGATIVVDATDTDDAKQKLKQRQSGWCIGAYGFQGDWCPTHPPENPNAPAWS